MRQMRDGRIGHRGDVDGRKTVSMEYRKKDKDEIGKPVNQNDVFSSSCQRGEGVEHYERSWQPTNEVEDQRDLSCLSTEDFIILIVQSLNLW